MHMPLNAKSVNIALAIIVEKNANKSLVPLSGTCVPIYGNFALITLLDFIVVIFIFYLFNSSVISFLYMKLLSFVL